MKSELTAKFLQHLNLKKKDGGFTLIELLVVIIIIGILSAIALPSFLNQANKAKQSEAKQYTGTLNRSQQAYYLEKSEFTANFDLLGKPIKTESDNYKYTSTVAADKKSVQNDAESTKDALKPYAGMVALGTVTSTSETTTLAVLCENVAPKTGKVDANPAVDATSKEPACVAKTVSLAK